MSDPSNRRFADDEPGAHSPATQQLWRLAEDTAHSVTVDDAEPRIEALWNLLGPRVCRRLGIYELPEGFVLSVVIPIFNERHTIEEVVRRVRATGLPVQIVLVDDGSTDGTRDILSSWQ